MFSALASEPNTESTPISAGRKEGQKEIYYDRQTGQKLKVEREKD